MARQSEPPPNNPTPMEAELRLPPSDPQTEKFVLGTVLLNPDALESVTALDPSCFYTEALRRIHARMVDMHERAAPVDAITLADELRKFGQLESVGGFSMLVSLSEGLPRLPAIDAYLQILRNYAGRRRLIALGTKMAEDAYRGEQSPVEIVGGATETWQEIESDSGQADDGGRTPAQVIEAYPGGISQFLDPSLRPKGLPTGFRRFDEMTTGMHKGEIYMIAARPGMGKTALALNIAEHLVFTPTLRKRIVLFSLEMTDDSLVTRMACARARVDSTRFRLGYLNKEERYRLQLAVSELQEARIRIYDNANPSIGEIIKIVRKVMDQEGLDLLILDYIQLMGQRRTENRHQELGQISRGFKVLAKECEIPVLLLSQLSRITDRRGGTSRPQLSDLRESGNLEEDASVVSFIFREELYKSGRTDLKGVAELIIAKSRHGALGMVPLTFAGQFTRFENASDEPPPQE